MNSKIILAAIVENTIEVIPELAQKEISRTDSLKELGANSMDRSEIIMMTLDSLSLNIPLVQLGGAKNIGELADLIYEKGV